MSKIISFDRGEVIKRLRGGLRDLLDRWRAKFQRRKPDDAFWSPAVLASLGRSVVFDERDDSLVVRAMFPGLGKKDVRVETTQNRLVIRFLQNRLFQAEEHGYYRHEERYVAFARAISLPCEIDPSRVKATLKHGLLTVTLPKSEQARRSRIRIPVAA